MFTMTVHGDRTQFPDKDSKYGHVPGSPGNGYIVQGEGKTGEPAYPNFSLQRSWNGCIWQLQPSPPERSPEIPHSSNMEIPLSGVSPSVSQNAKSRDSPVSLGSYHSSSTNDKLKFQVGQDDYDSATTVSSTMDSTDLDEEYVTLDRSYVFQSPRFSKHPCHHSSMIDLKHNQLYSPKITNMENANLSQSQTLPNRGKHRPILRSVSVEDRNDPNGPKTYPWAKRSLRRIYENIGTVLGPKPIVVNVNPRRDKDKEVSSPTNVKDSPRSLLKTQGSGESPRIPEQSEQVRTFDRRQRLRSHSVGDLLNLQKDNEKGDKSSSGIYSDDEDGDEFGFLSYPFATFSSIAMHKAKSPSPHHRILPKRWRGKGKPVNNNPGQCLWSPEGNCTWCHASGRKVVLRSISLLQLSEPERLALQKIALAKLQAMELGCPISIPKDHGDNKRSKRHVLSFKRSKSANLAGLIDRIADRDKEKDVKDVQPSGLVFGIPLSKCIANDAELQRKRSSGSLRERKDASSDYVHLRPEPRKSSSSSQGSIEDYTQNNGNTSNQKPTGSTDSLSESESSRNTNNSSLLDALSLSMSRQGSLQQGYLPLYATGVPQVPHIVNVCFKHIETYGLRVLGIFRVGSSKKRVKQLRDEFDSGKDVKLNESHNPHEVGALLKEYFRDLPEPLLTRDLYSALVATRGLSDDVSQASALRMIVSLLPVPNRDTLWALLEFLSRVSQHSTDGVDVNGQFLPGNKMDSSNLATLFGPNILHKAKPSEKEFLVESVERAEERKEVIEVVKDMVDNHMEIFTVSPMLHDEVLRVLVETDPDMTDHLFQKLSNEFGIEPDPDTTSSSIFGDSDTSSLPRSPCSDADLQLHTHRQQTVHPTLRGAKSDEALTPKTRRKFFFSNPPEDDRRKMDNSQKDERPRFHLRVERSPSPPQQRTPRTSRASRAPRVTITRDTSSPELTSMDMSPVTRPHSMHFDRPYTEMCGQNLSIPDNGYQRQNSCSDLGSCQDSPSAKTSRKLSPSPAPSGSNTPKTSARGVTSSRQRPLDLRRISSDSPVGSPLWQRERWKHWETLATNPTNDGYDQETLV